MRLTPEREARLKREYAIRHRRRLFLTLPLGLVVVLLAVAQGWHGGAIARLAKRLGVSGILVLAFGVAAWSLWNWRCPSCSRYLGPLWNPTFCRRCGARLRD